MTLVLPADPQNEISAARAVYWELIVNPRSSAIISKHPMLQAMPLGPDPARKVFIYIYIPIYIYIYVCVCVLCVIYFLNIFLYIIYIYMCISHFCLFLCSVLRMSCLQGPFVSYQSWTPTPHLASDSCRATSPLRSPRYVSEELNRFQEMSG